MCLNGTVTAAAPVAAVAQVRSLAREIVHATGAAKKRSSFCLLYGEQIVEAGTGAAHHMEVTAAVLAEVTMARTQ